MILREHGLVDPTRTAAAVTTVFAERTTVLPEVLPPFPAGWPDRYERIAREHGIAAATFSEATAIIHALWAELFPPTRKDS